VRIELAKDDLAGADDASGEEAVNDEFVVAQQRCEWRGTIAEVGIT